MKTVPPAQATAIDRFRALHAHGCFLLPNPWDIGTAQALEQLGCVALATTSAGYAFSRGRVDGAIPFG
ncbi:MAG: isocitrate lyase/phosphoenolpyruvate mutase family protein, partial [Chthoniobacterales bacterium]